MTHPPYPYVEHRLDIRPDAPIVVTLGPSPAFGHLSVADAIQLRAQLEAAIMMVVIKEKQP